MLSAIITFLYQPFLNLIVFFYWMLEAIGLGGDMGIAVILLTLVIRVLLLPITLASHRSENERREIEEKVHFIHDHYHGQPIDRAAAIKKLLRANPRILFAEMFMFVIQMLIALILWRIFATGLTGEDLHLLYSWMPEIAQPFNLTFLGRFDLTHPDWQLNVVQAFLVFVLETVSIITSPYRVSRAEVVRVQLVLPIVSFGIFAFLPAGKKLFVITTLSFSLVIILARSFVRWYRKIFSSPELESLPIDESGIHSADAPLNSSPNSLQ